jgi:nucleotide-binding universal stress UspA family protein
MHKYFNSILIPVDLTVNTELAVKKGVELADEGTVIHLLHVQPFFNPFFSGAAKDYFTRNINLSGEEDVDIRLNQWKKTIEESAPVKVCVWNVVASSVQDTIVQKASQLKVDLIIIGKHSSHSWFPFLNTVNPTYLVQNTGITVLTAKPGSMHNKVRRIVVPVSTRSVHNKMEIIIALNRKFRLRLYLATIMDNHREPMGFYAASLLDLYKWVKTTVGCPVEYAVLKGSNKAKAILNYVEKIQADVLLLYPDSETRIGWMNSEIGDVLPPSTKVEILTIQPQNSLTI